MAGPFTQKNLADVNDIGAKAGFEGIQEARFAGKDLDAERTGVAHIKLAAGNRQPFAHKHDEAEEVYIILVGSGRLKLDDEIIEVTELDAIRVAPEVVRQFEAGDDGLEFVVVGAAHESDGEVFPGWWSD